MTTDPFAPLHAEIPPPGTWARVAVAASEAEPGYLVDLTGRRRRPVSRWMAVAAAVVLVALAGVALRGGSDPDPLVPIGPCDLGGIAVDGLDPQPIPVDATRTVVPSSLGPVGPVSAFRAREGAVVVELFVGDFDVDAFFRVTAPPDDDIVPRDGVGTGGPHPHPTPGCTTIAAQAAGGTSEANAQVINRIVAALGES